MLFTFILLQHVTTLQQQYKQWQGQGDVKQISTRRKLTSVQLHSNEQWDTEGQIYSLYLFYPVNTVSKQLATTCLLPFATSQYTVTETLTTAGRAGSDRHSATWHQVCQKRVTQNQWIVALITFTFIYIYIKPQTTDWQRTLAQKVKRWIFVFVLLFCEDCIFYLPNPLTFNNAKMMSGSI